MSAVGMIVALVGLCACSKAPHEAPKEVLYEVMLRIDEKHYLELEEFPKAFEPVLGLYQGDIFTTGCGDTLQLVCHFPNLRDTVNRYPYYILRDNHGFYWKLFHGVDDKYRIYREDPWLAKYCYAGWIETLEKKWVTKVPSNLMGLIC